LKFEIFYKAYAPVYRVNETHVTDQNGVFSFQAPDGAIVTIKQEVEQSGICWKEPLQKTKSSSDPKEIRDTIFKQLSYRVTIDSDRKIRA